MARHARLLTLSIGAALLTCLPTVTAAASSGGWNNLGPAASFNPNYGSIQGKVQVLERSGSTLYAGGSFNNAAGIAVADRIAKWNGTAWSAACPTSITGDAAGGDVLSIAVDTKTGRVFAGGSFANAGGDTVADGLAVCRNGGWHSVGGVGFGSNISALEIVGRTLYVGGGFLDGADLPAADFVVAFGLDGGGWFAITDDSGDFGAGPSDIEGDGAGGVYMSGTFNDVDGVPAADYVVHYDGSGTWSALGSGPGPKHGAIQSQPGMVRGLAVATNGDLYAVGDFINVTGTGGDGDKIARWNGSTWRAVGSTSFFGESNLCLVDVVVDGPRVFVVGSFSNAGGQVKVDGVAAFKSGSWTNVGTNANGTDGPLTGPSPLLKDLAIVGSRLYVGGLDQDIGGGRLNDAVAFFRLRQPDALIGTNGSFAGNNVYNGDGTGQTRSRTVSQGATATFTLRVANDGFSVDDVTLKGPGNSGGFTVTYTAGSTDITAQVVAGTYAVTGLAPGQRRDVVLRVSVGAGVPNGASRSWLVVMTSAGSGASKDAVKATVTVS